MNINGGKLLQHAYLYDPLASRMLAVETQSSFNSHALIERFTVMLLSSSAAMDRDGRNTVDKTVAVAEDRNALLE